MVKKQILDIFVNFSDNLPYHGHIINERYIHHSFSHLLQQSYNKLDLFGNTSEIKIHPEWPTSKKATKLQYSKYKKIGKKYFPSDNGTAGFIDFAIGDYNRPEIGIELTFKEHWSKEELTYDFLKLLDSKNPFSCVFSFNVLYRDKELVKGNSYKDLELAIISSLNEARERLKERFSQDRVFYIIITEIDHQNNRQHWFKDWTMNGFQRYTNLKSQT